jgi:hypothetical protein
MTGPAAVQDRAGPYKGPHSFQTEDDVIFFGRERDGEQLTAKILMSRFTLVHARSGAGKTSLLNARVMPELERRGWTPIRGLLGDNPVRSTRLAALRDVLPLPDAEYRAIVRALQVLAGRDEDPALGELIARFDRLQPHDLRRRSLVAPVEVPAGPGSVHTGTAGLERVTPYFCRVLRSSLDADQFYEHMAAVRHAPSAVRHLRRIGLRRLADLIARDRCRSLYSDLAEKLDPPVPGLRPFFENLLECYGGLRPRLKLVLLFDQFEEIFTRFVDAGPALPARNAHLPNWRLRWEFFEEFEDLFKAPREDDGRGRLIRYVVTMRSEYIAQMDPVRRFVQDLDKSSFRLELLDVAQAGEAVREPAKLFGYDYHDDCYNAIINELTKEERFVEPSHLQVVCQRLWNERGRELAATSVAPADDMPRPNIGLETFVALGGARGILKGFFDDYLTGLDIDDRRESLELLQQLITDSGTRNIVERDQLVIVPYRHPGRRARLFGGLVDQSIVRVEYRLGSRFAEITHEFLIAPVLEAVRTQLNADIPYCQFLTVLRQLARYERVDPTDDDNLPSPFEFATLDSNHDRVAWTKKLEELMLRCAVVHGAAPQIVLFWANKVGLAAVRPEPAELMGEMRLRLEAGQSLSRSELKAVTELRDALGLDAVYTSLVQKSLLLRCRDGDEELIQAWFRNPTDG